MIDLTPEHLVVVKRILSEHIPAYEVRAFGSRVDGKTKRFADLDIVVMSEKPIPSEKMANIKEAFSESDLPFRVDILDWSGIGNEFKEIILRKNEVIQKPAK